MSRIPTRNQETGNTKTHQVFATIEETGITNSYHTFRLLKTSRNGSKYVFVAYNYDTNSILAGTIKNWTGK